MRCSLPRRGTQHAIHPNGSNHRRVPRLDVVARVRRLCETGLLKERPPWLEWCERVPPLENHSLSFQARTIRNPYPQMVNYLLKKHPDLRFQDCYVDGNDWSAGNDTYRDDHPVMQFVARQLDIMRTEGVSKKEAFRRTEELFRQRREHLEREQKVMMAFSMQDGLFPMFATGRAYLEAEKCNAEAAQLNRIRTELRKMRTAAEEKLRAEEAAALPQAEEAPPQEAPPVSRRKQERLRLRDEARQRLELVGQAVQPEFEAPQARPPAEETQAASLTADRLLDEPDREPLREPDEPEQQPDLFEAAVPPGDQSRETVQQKAAPVQPQPQPLDDDIITVVSSKKLQEKPRKSMGQVGAMLHGGGVLGEDGGEDQGDARSRKVQSRTGRGPERDQQGKDDFDDLDFDDGLGKKRRK